MGCAFCRRLIPVVCVGSGLLEFNHVEILPSLFSPFLLGSLSGEIGDSKVYSPPVPLQVPSQASVCSISLTRGGYAGSAGCSSGCHRGSDVGFSIQISADLLQSCLFCLCCWDCYHTAQGLLCSNWSTIGSFPINLKCPQLARGTESTGACLVLQLASLLPCLITCQKPFLV